MGACILNGFGAGPAETSQPEIIADIMFLHERGAYNTLYFTVYFGSLMVRCPLRSSDNVANTLLGWSNHRWAHGGAYWLAQLFLAERRCPWCRVALPDLSLPRNEMAPSSS